MSISVSLILSYRNRSIELVKLAMQSLQGQTFKNFEVIFVDYGSDVNYSKEVELVLNRFSFVKYIYVDSKNQLWSRSKALNIGFRHAKNNIIFISDIDLYFPSNTIELALSRYNLSSFLIFDWLFLSKKLSQKFNDHPEAFATREGILSDDNGMIMISRQAFEKIRGYDEFFHLYGGEDTDFKNRLQLAGFSKVKVASELKIYHLWHPHVIVNKNSELLPFPSVSNIKRVNEKHVFYNLQSGNPQWVGSDTWGVHPSFDFSLASPESFEFENILSKVIHFFEFVLPRLSNKVIEVSIFESEDFNSIKSKVKRLINKNTEVLISMQEVNEFISGKIIFNYRNFPYQYIIEKDKNKIRLRLKV